MNVEDVIKQNDVVAHEELLRRNIVLSGELGLPSLGWSKPHKKRMVIVGGGPSLEKNLNRLRRERDKGAFIVTTNAVHDYLISKGIQPNACVFVDASPHMWKKVTPFKDCIYFVASQCHLATFIKLEGFTVVRWHCDNGRGYESELAGPDEVMIKGGSTAVMRTPAMGWVMGFRDFVFMGVDSSYCEGRHHAYEQMATMKRCVATFRGKAFETDQQMAFQARDFMVCWDNLKREDCRVQVVGDGLIPEIYRMGLDDKPKTTELEIDYGDNQLFDTEDKPSRLVGAV